jgi:hypothetical protein
MLSDTLLATQHIDEPITSDSIKPRCERSPVIERVPRVMHRDKRFLHDVIDPRHRRPDA